MFLAILVIPFTLILTGRIKLGGSSNETDSAAHKDMELGTKTMDNPIHKN